MGSRSPMRKGSFEREGAAHRKVWGPSAVSELCKNGWNDRGHVWDVNWVGSKEAYVLDGVSHWRNLANTIEPSMYGGDAVFLSNYTVISCSYSCALVFWRCWLGNRKDVGLVKLVLFISEVRFWATNYLGDRHVDDISVRLGLELGLTESGLWLRLVSVTQKSVF